MRRLCEKKMFFGHIFSAQIQTESAAGASGASGGGRQAVVESRSSYGPLLFSFHVGNECGGECRRSVHRKAHYRQAAQERSLRQGDAARNLHGTTGEFSSVLLSIDFVCRLATLAAWRLLSRPRRMQLRCCGCSSLLTVCR